MQQHGDGSDRGCIELREKTKQWIHDDDQEIQAEGSFHLVSERRRQTLLERRSCVSGYLDSCLLETMEEKGLFK